MGRIIKAMEMGIPCHEENFWDAPDAHREDQEISGVEARNIFLDGG